MKTRVIYAVICLCMILSLASGMAMPPGAMAVSPAPDAPWYAQDAPPHAEPPSLAEPPPPAEPPAMPDWNQPPMESIPDANPTDAPNASPSDALAKETRISATPTTAIIEPFAEGVLGLTYNIAASELRYSGGVVASEIPGWSGDGNTLTLDGFEYICTDAGVGTVLTLPANTTLVIEGDNTITGTGSGSGIARGINAQGALTIRGGGALTVAARISTGSNSQGMFVNGSVTIEGGAITAIGNTAGGGFTSRGLATGANGSLNMVGGTFTAQGRSSAISLNGTGVITGDVDIKGWDGSDYTVDGVFSDSENGVVRADTNVTIRNARISVKARSLYFGDGALTYGPGGDVADNLSGWGANGNTLTLNDFNFNTAAGDALTMAAGTALVIDGTNAITGTNGDGVHTEGDLAVSGGGTLTATGSGIGLNIAGNFSYGMTGGAIYARGSRAIEIGGAASGDFAVGYGNNGGYDTVGSLSGGSPQTAISASDNPLQDAALAVPQGLPQAEIDFVGERLTGLAPSAGYIIDGAPYSADAGGSIAISQEWIGSEIGVVKAGFEPFANSQEQSIELPPRPAAPEIGKTNTAYGQNNGEITGVDATMEYRRGTATITWTPITGDIVTGLTGGFAYQVRLKAVEGESFAGEPASVVIATSEAPNAQTLYYNEADESLHYGSVNGDIANDLGGWEGDGATLTLTGFSFITSAATVLYLPETTTLIIEGVNTLMSTGSNVGGVYGINAREDLAIQGGGSLSVTSGTSTNNSSSGLYSGGNFSMVGGTLTIRGGNASQNGYTSYGMRVAGGFAMTGGEINTGSGNGAIRTAASVSGEITGDLIIKGRDSSGGYTIDSEFDGNIVSKSGGTRMTYARIKTGVREETPSAGIDFINEWLTGLASGAGYRIDGAEHMASGGYIGIMNAWFGETVDIVKLGNYETTVDSSARELLIPARPAAPTAPTGGVLRITGVDTDMQYRKPGDPIWVLCDDTLVTGLTAGTYEVRYAAVANESFASEIKSVTVSNPLPEETPNAAIDYVYEQLTGLAACAAYTVNGTAFAAGADGTINIAAGWFGTTVEIVKKGNEDGTSLDSAVRWRYIPPRPSAPAEPAGGVNRITGVDNDMEYKHQGAPGDWIACPAGSITGLTAGTYEVRTRAIAGSSFASAIKSIEVTDPMPEETPSAIINYVLEQIIGLTPGAEYSIDGEEYTADAYGYIAIVDEWFGAAISIVKAGNGDTTVDSAAQSLAIPARPIAPTAPDGGVSRITGVSADMEYRLSGGGWTACIGDIAAGLDAGAYEVRLKAVAGNSFASAAKSVTVTDPAKEGTPSAAIDYASERLTGLTPNADYTIDGEAYLADASGDIAIIIDWFGDTVGIVRTGALDGTTLDSEAQELEIPARPSAPIGPTGDARRISGLTSNNTMEHRLSGADVWTTVDSVTISGLEPGEYEVRLKATDSAFTGEVLTVTVTELPQQPTPQAEIDYVGERIVNLVTAGNRLYIVNGVTRNSNNDDAIAFTTISPGLANIFDTTVTIVKTGIPNTSLDSETQELYIPARPITPELVKLSDTAGGDSGGAISGVDATMEYRLGSGDWTKIEEDDLADGNTLTGLGGGVYQIRVAASQENENFASVAVTVNISGSSQGTGNNTGPDNRTLYYNPADGTLRYDSISGPLADDRPGWSGDGSTLTLTGFSYSTSASQAMVIAGNTRLVLNGVNNLESTYIGTGDAYGIFTTSGLTFEGGGELIVQSGESTDGASVGLRANVFTMNYGSVRASGGSAATYSYGVQNRGILTMNGGVLTGEGGTGAISYGLDMINFSFVGGTVYASGTTNAAAISGAYSTGIEILGYDGSAYSIPARFNTDDPKKTIVNEASGAILNARITRYDPSTLFLNTEDGKLHYGNKNGPVADDVYGWSYDNGVLTLEDFHYMSDAPAAINLPYDEDIVIELIGENSITTTYNGPVPTYGIKAANTDGGGAIIEGNTGSLTIRGEGSLNSRGGTSGEHNSDGLTVGGDLTIDIKGTLDFNGGNSETSSYGLFVGGKLTMINGIVNATARLSDSDSVHGSIGIDAMDFDMQGGAIYAANDNTIESSFNYGILVRDDFSMSGGRVYAKTADNNAFVVFGGVTLPENAEVRGSGQNDFTDGAYTIDSLFSENDEGRDIAAPEADPDTPLENVRIRLLYKVTLRVRKDNAAWAYHNRIYYLKQNDAISSTGTPNSDNTITFSDPSTGTYDIFDGTTDTGVDITVIADSDGNADVDYYTVTLNIVGGNGTDKVALGGVDYTGDHALILLRNGTLPVLAVPSGGRSVSAFSDSVETGKAIADATLGYITSAITAPRVITVAFEANAGPTPPFITPPPINTPPVTQPLGPGYNDPPDFSDSTNSYPSGSVPGARKPSVTPSPSPKVIPTVAPAISSSAPPLPPIPVDSAADAGMPGTGDSGEAWPFAILALLCILGAIAALLGAMHLRHRVNSRRDK